MFVISFVEGSILKATAIRETADDAVELAYEWYDTYHYEGNDGYIAIDERVKGKKENARFAEIHLDAHSKLAKLELFLDLEEEDGKKRKPIFSKKFNQFSKQVLVFFLELAYLRLNEYFKEKNKNRSDY